MDSPNEQTSNTQKVLPKLLAHQLNECISTEITLSQNFQALWDALEKNKVVMKKFAKDYGLTEVHVDDIIRHVKVIAEGSSIWNEVDKIATSAAQTVQQQQIIKFIKSTESALFSKPNDPQSGQSHIQLMLRYVSLANLTLIYQVHSNCNFYNEMASPKKVPELATISLSNGQQQNFASLMSQAFQRAPRYRLLFDTINKEIADGLRDNPNNTYLLELQPRVKKLLEFYKFFSGEVNQKILLSDVRAPLQPQLEIVRAKISQLTAQMHAKNATALDKINQSLEEFTKVLDNIPKKQLAMDQYGHLKEILNKFRISIEDFCKNDHVLPTAIPALDISYLANIQAAAKAAQASAAQESSIFEKLSASLSGAPKATQADVAFLNARTQLIMPLFMSMPQRFTQWQDQSAKGLSYTEVQQNVQQVDILKAFSQKSSDLSSKEQQVAKQVQEQAQAQAQIKTKVKTLEKQATQHAEHADFLFQSTTAMVELVYQSVPSRIVQSEQYAPIPLHAVRLASSMSQAPPVASLDNTAIMICDAEDSQNLVASLGDAYSQHKNKTIAMMIASNADHIGSNWTDGVGTQEQSLYFTTDMYKRSYLLAQAADARPFPHTLQSYKHPLEHLALTEPTDESVHAIYTPNVICFRKAESLSGTMTHSYKLCTPFTFNVISIAGFDLRCDSVYRKFMDTHGKFLWSAFEDGMAGLYQLAMQAAVNRGDKLFVGIPLGCNVFAHPYEKEKTYEHVARGFFRALKQYSNQFEGVYMVAIEPKVSSVFTEQLMQERSVSASMMSSSTTSYSSSSSSSSSSSDTNLTTGMAVSTSSSMVQGQTAGVALAPASVTQLPMTVSKSGIPTADVLGIFATMHSANQIASSPQREVAFKTTVQVVNAAYQNVPLAVLQSETYATVKLNVNQVKKAFQPHTVAMGNLVPAKTAKTIFSICSQQDSQNLMSSLRCVYPQEQIAAMNAANAIWIGGGWEYSKGTQEESLFFCTDLFKRLYPLALSIDAYPKGNSEQRYQQPMTHACFQTEAEQAQAVHGLYTPNVICYRKAQSNKDTIGHIYQPCMPFAFNGISIPGFDLREDLTRRKFVDPTTKEFSWEKFTENMAKLYEFTFQTALQRGDTILAAIPLGCGAFAYPGQEKKTYECVAQGFFRALKNYAHQFKGLHMVAINPLVAAAFNAQLAREDVASLGIVVDQTGQMPHQGVATQPQPNSNENRLPSANEMNALFANIHMVSTNPTVTTAAPTTTTAPTTAGANQNAHSPGGPFAQPAAAAVAPVVGGQPNTPVVANPTSSINKS